MDSGMGICFKEREMEGILLMMRKRDGGCLMEYVEEETHIRKCQRFYFGWVQ